LDIASANGPGIFCRFGKLLKGRFWPLDEHLYSEIGFDFGSAVGWKAELSS
jgi:hypothetical protein